MLELANQLTNELLKYVLIFDAIFIIIGACLIKWGGQQGKQIGKTMIIGIFIGNAIIFFYKDITGFFQKNKNW